jgi:predicted histone-like DNA-binding protein
MANYVLQELPEEMADGKKVVFPKMQTYSLHDFDTVIKHMRDYAGNLSEGTIRAVFDAFTSVMESWMPMGHTIKVDGLGVFSLSLGFDTSTPSEKEMQHCSNTAKEPKDSYRHVCIKNINFKPDAELIKRLNSQATFNRVETNIVSPQRTKLTYEERITKAKAIINQQGYMTLTDYAIATEQSRTAASIDLKKISATTTSGITTRGSHSHKVWVKSV